MTKILFLFLLMPIISHSEETVQVTETFSTGGIIFLVVSWTGIIVWNLLCFTKLLKKH